MRHSMSHTQHESLISLAKGIKLIRKSSSESYSSYRAIPTKLTPTLMQGYCDKVSTRIHTQWLTPLTFYPNGSNENKRHKWHPTTKNKQKHKTARAGSCMDKPCNIETSNCSRGRVERKFFEAIEVFNLHRGLYVEDEKKRKDHKKFVQASAFVPLIVLHLSC